MSEPLSNIGLIEPTLNDPLSRAATLSNDHLIVQYREIWNTLSSVDVSDQIEKKNGLSYLSWAWAWGVLMRYYPHATYQFSPDEMHHDATVTVHCTVKIGDCHRSMWLPVMDYKNNSVVAPDSRKVSDTRMRCLVKCLAMFGLGHYIYAGEDLPPSNGNPENAPVEVETRVEKPKPKREKPKAPTAKGDNNIPTEEGAVEVVQKLLEFANKFCTDNAGLVGFWKENKQVIDIIDSNYPAQYEVLKQGFTQLKNKFGGNDNG